jgi:hypothetical protein
VFIVCVDLCSVFCLIVVLFCVMCVICVLCLIVVPLPPGKNPFAVKTNNNNSIQFFIIYVPSQQLQGQLQTQHSVDTVNYIIDTHNIKPKINYRKLLEENALMVKVNKQTSKQIKMRVNKNYITQYIIRIIK